jgi:hypothetical protein
VNKKDYVIEFYRISKKKVEVLYDRLQMPSLEKLELSFKHSQTF